MNRKQSNQQPSKPTPTSKQDKAIHYNEEAEKYAKNGKVEQGARKAREAISDPKQAAELREAEKAGKRRIQQ